MTRATVHGRPEWKIEWVGKEMHAHTERDGWEVGVVSDEMAPEALALILVGVGIKDAAPNPLIENSAVGHMVDEVYDDFMALVERYGWTGDVVDNLFNEEGETNAETEQLDA